MSNSSQLEIGASAGGDFTVVHDGTDTTMTNNAGNLNVILPTDGSLKVDGTTNAFDMSGGSGVDVGNLISREMTGTMPNASLMIARVNQFDGDFSADFTGNKERSPKAIGNSFTGVVKNNTWSYTTGGKQTFAAPEYTCLELSWQVTNSHELINNSGADITATVKALDAEVQVVAAITQTSGALTVDMIGGNFKHVLLGGGVITGTPTLNYIGGNFVGDAESVFTGTGTPTVTSTGGRFCAGNAPTNTGLLIQTITDAETLNIGLDIQAISGSTTNWAILSRGGDSQFNGDIQIIAGNKLNLIASDSDQGDIYHDATDLVIDPAVVGSGSLKTLGGRIIETSRYTTTQTLDTTDHIVFGNTDSAAWTVSLPAGVAGTTYKITNTGSSGNNLTVAPNGAEDLLGANSNFTLFDGESLIITYDATDGWY